MLISKYNGANKEILLKILSNNIPKYFFKDELELFEAYLLRKQWARFIVFSSEVGKVMGFSSYSFEPDGLLHIDWMAFAPGSVGLANMNSNFLIFHQYLIKDMKENLLTKIKLDTTPKISRFLMRFGYKTKSLVKDGYTQGYDKVFMEYILE